MPDLMKQCTRCGEYAAHGPNRARVSGYQSQCRDCLNAHRLGNYYTWRDSLLAGRSCNLCGSTKDLEFDHMDRSQKRGNVSVLWGNKAQALAEAAKCWVLCHECHLERSLTEGHFTAQAV